jgi:hypothetical protein
MKKEVLLECDLSTSDLPRIDARKFTIKYAGCTAHASRPFWRYRDINEETQNHGALFLRKILKKMWRKSIGISCVIDLKFFAKFGNRDFISRNARYLTGSEFSVTLLK